MSETILASLNLLATSALASETVQTKRAINKQIKIKVLFQYILQEIFCYEKSVT